jgi:hypothetical protein
MNGRGCPGNCPLSGEADEEVGPIRDNDSASSWKPDIGQVLWIEKFQKRFVEACASFESD